MELAMLKYLTRQALVKAKKELTRDCNFDPFATIIGDDSGGTLASVPIPDQAMRSGNSKELLFAMLAEICRISEAPGLITVTDGWSMEHTAEQRKRLESDSEYARRFEEITSNEGLRQAAEAGFGRLVESIICQGQTREHAYGMMQYYERVAKAGVIPAKAAVGSDATLSPHTIRYRGEPHVLSSESGKAGGRMFGLFEGNVEPATPEVTEKVAELIAKFSLNGWLNMADWKAVPIPKRMRGLTKDRRGYPIPFTVMRDSDGRPHFTVNDAERQIKAAKERRCAICGNHLGQICWVVGGPLAAFHEMGAYVDLALHDECKTYALKVCPYLAMPNYLGRIDDKTVDKSKLIDPGMISMNLLVTPERPALFVAVASHSYELIDQETLKHGKAELTIQRVAPLIKPVRPYASIEYWLAGEQLPEERGQMLSAIALSEAQLCQP